MLAFPIIRESWNPDGPADSSTRDFGRAPLKLQPGDVARGDPDLGFTGATAATTS